MISLMRQDEPTVRSYAVTHPAGTVVMPQPHGWDQLVHASSGVMTVRTADARWVVPRHRAVWVPSGLTHTIELHGRVKLRSLYLRAGLAGIAGDGARPVNVSPLLRELILQAVADAPLWLDRPRDARLIGVLVDHLELLDDVALQLPTPVDPRAVAVAEAIVADPSAPTALAVLARGAGASVRTVERLFRAETTMTVQQWRTRARLLAGLEQLAAGASVTAAAVGCGYSSPSAFGAAFKAELGISPRAYLVGT
jgi:AraC-like DNA-binding protein